MRWGGIRVGGVDWVAWVCVLVSLLWPDYGLSLSSTPTSCATYLLAAAAATAAAQADKWAWTRSRTSSSSSAPLLNPRRCAAMRHPGACARSRRARYGTYAKWSLVGVGRQREVEQYPDSSSQIVPSGRDSSKPSLRESNVSLVIYSNVPLLSHAIEQKQFCEATTTTHKDRVYRTYHTWLNYTTPGRLDIGSTYASLWCSS